MRTLSVLAEEHIFNYLVEYYILTGIGASGVMRFVGFFNEYWGTSVKLYSTSSTVFMGCVCKLPKTHEARTMGWKSQILGLKPGSVFN